MWKRRLESIRQLEAEASRVPPPIAYNPGTMSDPLPAVERAMAAFRRRVRGNPIAAYDKCRMVMRELRVLAAEVFGGEPTGWAFAEGHTASIDRIAGSLAQLLGGEGPIRVVTTNSEHIGGVGAFTADPRFLVEHVSPERMPETPGRVFFLSHLTYDTNRDLGEVIRAVVRRGDAPIVVVDGNQAIGQVDVDVAELGCHLYLASAHKWLGGPHGTGLLYLRADAIESWPSPFHAGVPLCEELPIGRWEPRGGQDFSRIAGVAAAVRAYQCHAHSGRELRDLFVARLREALGERAHVLSESTPNGRVVALELEGMDVYPVYRRLSERGLSVKCIKKPHADVTGGRSGLEVLRIGFPWWTDQGRVEDAIAILRETVAEVASAAPAAAPPSAA